MPGVEEEREAGGGAVRAEERRLDRPPELLPVRPVGGEDALQAGRLPLPRLGRPPREEGGPGGVAALQSVDLPTTVS